eukprot:6211844-Pleurochrysis_carterae.AAC.4
MQHVWLHFLTRSALRTLQANAMRISNMLIVIVTDGSCISDDTVLTLSDELYYLWSTSTA